MDDLADMTKQLRAGDRSQINPICTKLLPLIISIARQFGREDEWVGAACLTLVEAVNLAQEKLEDDNITAFVTARVRWRLKDAYNEEAHWCIPARSRRQYGAEGQRIALDLYNAVTRPDRVSVDFKDLIESIVQTDMEMAYVEMRSASYSLQEIADEMDVSLSTVQRARALLKARYEAVA